MQSSHIKYFMSKKKDLFLFFHEGNTLYYKIQTPSGWSQAQILAEQTGPAFSVSHYDAIIYVLYSTLEGNLVLAKTTDMSFWEKKPLISDKRDLSNTKIFFLPEQASFHIVYHLPTETTNVQWLVYAVFKDGHWEKPYRIDRFVPFQGEPFLVGRITRNHIVLYYRSSRNVISSREMLLSPYTLGSVNPVIQTSYPCTDLSIISDSERIHLLYTVKGMFRTQIVYQYKQASSISTPRVIWEDSSCEQCLIYKENGKLQLTWVANGRPYICTSNTNGTTFGTVEKYTSYFPKKCMKGELITACEEPPYIASEAFSDVYNGYMMTMLGNSCLTPFHKMFSSPSPFEHGPAPTEPKSPSIPVNQQNISAAEQGPILMQDKRVYSSNTTIGYTQDTLPQYAALFESQKQQVEELSRLLAQRGEEIADVNAKWREQTARQEEEISQLKQALVQSQQENEQLTETITQLKKSFSESIDTAPDPE